MVDFEIQGFGVVLCAQIRVRTSSEANSQVISAEQHEHAFLLLRGILRKPHLFFALVVFTCHQTKITNSIDITIFRAK
jgi:hypothetical protein